MKGLSITIYIAILIALGHSVWTGTIQRGEYYKALIMVTGFVALIIGVEE